MCTQLGLARSSFYAWRTQVNQVSASAARREVLKVLIQEIYHEHRKTYGCRRITAELNDRGYPASVGLVAKLMRELGLAGIQPRAYRRTTIVGEEPVVIPDLLEGNFDPAAHAPGHALVGDITYLRTGEGWLYLATVIDLSTRMVVGWQMASHMRTSLVIDALGMAIDHGRIAPNSVFHADKGSQYTSSEFQKYCEKVKVRPSVGRTGVCWDNAVAESFFASLKNEMYYHQVFTTRARARFAVMDYIEVFYNRQRRHCALGYRTPVQTWQDHEKDLAATAA